MPSSYLQAPDLATFGVPNATQSEINYASALIDTYLKRKLGLIWEPDAAGNPCYMAGASPAAELALTSAIAAGQTVNATVSGPTMMLQVGDVLVADIANSAATEALVIASVSGQNITFQNVNYAHASGAILSGGMLIVEQRTMPENRPITRVSELPVRNMMSGTGRYGYMRRSDDMVGTIDTYNLLAVMSRFGGPPAWETWTPQANSIDNDSGTVWIPAGVLLAYYTEVRMHYVAGWTYATLPFEIKQACASIIGNMQALAGVPLSMQTVKAGDTQMTRFGAQPGALNIAYITDDVKLLLHPYQARVMA